MKTSSFAERHIGTNEEATAQMLQIIGVDSLDQLIDETIPDDIRLKESLKLPEAMTEHRFMKHIKELAGRNKIYKSHIGLGYYDTILPGVIQRNILENPGWYTAYTPYQAEISQGRLEALLNFQTMITDLTGMEIANASLLDEATAAAEAMLMLYSLRSREQKKAGAHQFFVSEACFPQTIEVLKTRSEPYGIELIIGDHQDFEFSESVYGALLQYPGKYGQLHQYEDFVKKAKASGASIAVAADIMSLALLTPPGEWGADVVVGTTQRFGIPMGYGGPHAAYFATQEAYKRNVPGRIIGVSQDMDGGSALRMALQTREQHIKRERATSNICTAQVLLAVMAGMYSVYHGPKGLRQIAQKIHQLTVTLSEGLQKLGYKIHHKAFFDTLHVGLANITQTGEAAEHIKRIAEAHKLNLLYIDEKSVGISIDETCDLNDINILLEVFAKAMNTAPLSYEEHLEASAIPPALQRSSDYLTHPVFNRYHSETEMMRYIKKLERKDLSLNHSMIPLGSCTMKLNAATELLPLSWPSFGNIHPFAPVYQAVGYQELFRELENALSEITAFAATSLQPNSGAQGEYAGLMVIRAYHKSRDEDHRDVVLIPSSAHGTNPASGVMAGMKVVVVACDDKGNIDVEDLKSKAEKHSDQLAALMITYPSTHGVFEARIKEVTAIIHQHGGQVYMDGANMNAQVGLTAPGVIGADVCHLNLHKTFAIPHGGGGPGMGPIAVAAHLAPFLPSNPMVKTGGEKGIRAISAAPWGSGLILIISYAYIKMLGTQGLTDATKIAILNANYMKALLEKQYDILYTGDKGRVAHEMILECRNFKKAGIEVTDIAKRLMDYGFHAPTVSFPVAGTLMIEPTESESKEELDRFCEAMNAIKEEIDAIASGEADPENNVLKNAPHTLELLTGDNWNFPYSRQKAAYPLDWLQENKFWPAVRRVDNAYGDRNLICTCEPINTYEEILTY